MSFGNFYNNYSPKQDGERPKDVWKLTAESLQRVNSRTNFVSLSPIVLDSFCFDLYPYNPASYQPQRCSLVSIQMCPADSLSFWVFQRAPLPPCVSLRLCGVWGAGVPSTRWAFILILICDFSMGPGNPVPLTMRIPPGFPLCVSSKPLQVFSVWTNSIRVDAGSTCGKGWALQLGGLRFSLLSFKFCVPPCKWIWALKSGDWRCSSPSQELRPQVLVAAGCQKTGR